MKTNHSKTITPMSLLRLLFLFALLSGASSCGLIDDSYADTNMKKKLIGRWSVSVMNIKSVYDQQTGIESFYKEYEYGKCTFTFNKDNTMTISGSDIFDFTCTYKIQDYRIHCSPDNHYPFYINFYIDEEDEDEEIYESFVFYKMAKGEMIELTDGDIKMQKMKDH